MVNAKIGELKNHLSRYLERVRRGESVRILDRTRPIARIVPEQKHGSGHKAWSRESLLELERQGLLKVGHMRGVPALLTSPPGPRKSGVLDQLLKDRRSSR